MSPGDFEFVKRYEALATPDYLCELDEYRRPDGAQLMMCHIRVHHWSAPVFKKILREWRLFRTVCKAPLFACPEVSDDKWHKFVTALGFKPLLADVPCENGERRPVYLSTV